MRLGVFFSKENKELAEETIQGLTQLEHCQVQGFQLETGWENSDGQEMQFHFSHVDMFILVTGELEDPFALGPWSHLVLGFALGKDAGLCFFASRPIRPLNLYKHIPILYSRLDLNRFLTEEHRIWQQEHRIQQARESLIDLGIGLNEENLARRVVLGDLETVDKFLTIGFSPDAADPSGSSLLVLAIRNGHEALAAGLVYRGADVNIASEDRGNTPLMEAAIRGSFELAAALCAAGADLNMQSKAGQTALMLAIGEGHIDLARHLVSLNADLEKVDQLGMTARKYAALFGHKGLVEAIDSRLQNAT